MRRSSRAALVAAVTGALSVSLLPGVAAMPGTVEDRGGSEGSAAAEASSTYWEERQLGGSELRGAAWAVANDVVIGLRGQGSRPEVLRLRVAGSEPSPARVQALPGATAGGSWAVEVEDGGTAFVVQTIEQGDDVLARSWTSAGATVQRLPDTVMADVAAGGWTTHAAIGLGSVAIVVDGLDSATPVVRSHQLGTPTWRTLPTPGTAPEGMGDVEDVALGPHGLLLAWRDVVPDDRRLNLSVEADGGWQNSLFVAPHGHPQGDNVHGSAYTLTPDEESVWLTGATLGGSPRAIVARWVDGEFTDVSAQQMPRSPWFWPGMSQVSGIVGGKPVVGVRGHWADTDDGLTFVHEPQGWTPFGWHWPPVAVGPGGVVIAAGWGVALLRPDVTPPAVDVVRGVESRPRMLRLSVADLGGLAWLRCSIAGTVFAEHTYAAPGSGTSLTQEGACVGRKDLEEGVHEVRVEATDWAGHSIDERRTWTLDQTDPVASWRSGEWTNKRRHVYRWRSADRLSGLQDHTLFPEGAGPSNRRAVRLRAMVTLGSEARRWRTKVLPRGASTCVLLSANDRAGNRGQTSHCVASALDDTQMRKTMGGLSVPRSEVFRTVRGRKAIGGQATELLWSGRSASGLTYRPYYDAGDLAVRAYTCPRCGTLRVRYRGTREVSLRSARPGWRTIVVKRITGKPVTMGLRLSKAGGGRVVVDAVYVKLVPR